MKLVKFIAAAALSLSSIAASASLLSIVGGTPGVDIPSPANNFESNFPVAQTYTVGGSLQANDNIVVTFYWLGAEASWNNQILIAGGTKSITRVGYGGTHAPISETTLAGQFVDFKFYSPEIGTSVANGAGGTVIGNGRTYTFATALNVTVSAGNGIANAGWYDAVLFLDDTGPSTKDDDNHDDLLIGVRVKRVPEPSTLLLMGLGLLGLAGARRLKA